MGRFYNIVIGDGTTFASQVNGQDDPGALNIELDIPVAPEHLRKSGAFVRVWGIPLSTISQAKNFNQQSIQVYGGMSSGLPLANPAQQGLLVNGIIYPALGNWVGVDMTLDFILAPPLGTDVTTKPANIVHQHTANQPMSGAIQTALHTAFPGMTTTLNISPSLVQSFTDNGFYQTLGQYAQAIRDRSRSIMNSASYPGITTSVQGTKIVLSDGTQSSSSGKTINFQDLIGQPTWIGPNTIQFKTVMRGDINISDVVTLPPSLATTTQAAFVPGSSQSNSSVFQGNVTIQQMRHVGNFRQLSWASWNTTFDAILQSTSGNPSISGVGHQ
jgi:hypothetical protein